MAEQTPAEYERQRDDAYKAELIRRYVSSLPLTAADKREAKRLLCDEVRT